MTAGMDDNPGEGLGRAFTGLWGATAAANLADGVTLVLLPLVALQRSTAPAAVAGVTVALTAAWPLFGLPAGWVVDAVDRRRLLVVVNLARAAVLAAVAVAAVTGQPGLALLYAAALLLGAGETLADTALTALVPMVVSAERRGTANARIETTINLLNQLAGPPLAGVLLAVGAAVAAGAAAGLYVLALAGLAMLPRLPFARTRGPARAAAAAPDPAQAGGRAGWWPELAAGMRALWGEPLLRRMTLLTAAMNVVWAVWAALFPLYAVAPGPLGLTPAQYGLLLTAMAVGGLAAAPLVDPLTRRLGVRAVLILDLVGTVALVGPAAAGLGLAPVAVGVVAAGAGATVWRAVVATLRQNLVEERLMGRVYAASRFLSWGVLPFGAALAGLLAEAAGTRATFATATALGVALLVAFPRAVRGHDLNRRYRAQEAETPSP